MRKAKAMSLITALSLGIVLSLVSASSGQMNPSRVGGALESRASSSRVDSSAVQSGAHPQSAAAELHAVGGEPTCAGLAGLATGLALGAVLGCGPICLGLALGVVVMAAGC